MMRFFLACQRISHIVSQPTWQPMVPTSISPWAQRQPHLPPLPLSSLVRCFSECNGRPELLTCWSTCRHYTREFEDEGWRGCHALYEEGRTGHWTRAHDRCSPLCVLTGKTLGFLTIGGKLDVSEDTNCPSPACLLANNTDLEGSEATPTTVTINYLPTVIAAVCTSILLLKVSPAKAVEELFFRRNGSTAVVCPDIPI